jgi:hypothetical protein
MAGTVGALDFQTLVFTPGCASPAGTFTVRDPSTGWWEIVLPDDCSGCGPLTWYGEDHGTVCVGASLQEAVLTRLGDDVADPP